MKREMKTEWMKALIFWGIAVLVLFVTAPIAGAGNLYDSVIRLHVLANSDTAEDQAVKLAVRDGLLEYAAEHLSLSQTREEAARELERHLGEMEDVAEAIVKRTGKEEAVTVTLTEEAYPTREYEAISLPAGDYLSLPFAGQDIRRLRRQ